MGNSAQPPAPGTASGNAVSYTSPYASQNAAIPPPNPATVPNPGTFAGTPPTDYSGNPATSTETRPDKIDPTTVDVPVPPPSTPAAAYNDMLGGGSKHGSNPNPGGGRYAGYNMGAGNLYGLSSGPSGPASNNFGNVDASGVYQGPTTEGPAYTWGDVGRAAIGISPLGTIARLMGRHI